ncbi:transposase, MuDR, MULE transposase domain protein [Tanacetum coccineum]
MVPCGCLLGFLHLMKGAIRSMATSNARHSLRGLATRLAITPKWLATTPKWLATSLLMIFRRSDESNKDKIVKPSTNTDYEVEALVQKLIDEDKVHQNAIMDLALQFENSCTAKDDLRKAYEKFRIIPGPAGIVQQAKLLKERDIFLGWDGAVMSTQEYMQKVVEDVDEDDDFKSGPWISVTEYGYVKYYKKTVKNGQKRTRERMSDQEAKEIKAEADHASAFYSPLQLNHSQPNTTPTLFYKLRSVTEYVNANGGTVSGCLADIDNNLKKEKLDQVVAIIKSCSPNGYGDLTVNMKDLSGIIPGTVHYKVIDEGGYGKDITIGAAMILANLSHLDNVGNSGMQHNDQS